MKQDEGKYHPTTRLIHGRHRSEAWEYGHHLVPPISTSSTFRLDSVVRGAMGFQEFARSDQDDHHIYIYERLGEPNKDLLEENLAMAERGDVAVSFASGMAAISAILCSLLEAGTHLVAHPVVYGCTHSLLHNWLPRFGIRTTHADLLRPETLSEAVRPETRVVYFETPVNPNMEIIDIRAVASAVAELNQRRSPEDRIYVVVDNTFATPFCQRPLEHGADFVVTSLTKGISGFGTDMGGAVIAPRSFRDRLLLYRKDFGGVLSPRSAWTILTYGLTSLSIRIRHAQQSAAAIADFLTGHPAVDFVAYPGLTSFAGYEAARRQMRDYADRFAPGVLLYFELKGDTPADRQAAGIRFINHLSENAYTITLAVSLGNVRSLVEHPSSMTHAPIPPEEQARIGIQPGGIRLSVGLEETEDLIRDLQAALEVALSEPVT